MDLFQSGGDFVGREKINYICSVVCVFEFILVVQKLEFANEKWNRGVCHVFRGKKSLQSVTCCIHELWQQTFEIRLGLRPRLFFSFVLSN